MAGALLAAAALSSPACGDDPGPAPPAVGCEGCVALTGGLVFDGTRAGLGTVVLEGDRVREVVFGDAQVVAGDVVDAAGKTVMPGLVDLHVHLRGSAAPYGYFPDEDHAEDHLKAMLRSGVTTFLDLGTSQGYIFEYRERARAGKIFAPNLFAAGPLLTATGGHPCYSGSPAREFCLFIDTPADVDAAFDALLPSKPDVIKVVIDSGLTKPLPQTPDDSIAAVASAAASAGLDVFAHVAEAEDVRIALDRGVRVFAHVPALDAMPPDLAAALAEKGGALVPTLVLFDSIYRVAHGMLDELGDPALADDVPAEVIAALGDPAVLGGMTSPDYQALVASLRQHALDNVRICHEAGVVIAAGTDSGNPGTFHGLAVARELALQVEAGLTPLEALTAGTRTPAELLGRDDLGRLVPGAVADVLVVEGDATADIEAVARVAAVYRAGRRVDRQALSVTGTTSLTEMATEGLGEDATCLDEGECSAELYCSFLSTCDPECLTSAQCGTGNLCFPQDTGSKGFCLEGDGCDPIAQDCDNGAPCIWLGNGATLCWYAGAPEAGEPCSALGTCAVGSQCEYFQDVCKQNCDPADPGGGGCPTGQACIDKSAAAGLPVGQCE